jgi:hypothetical protein
MAPTYGHAIGQDEPALGWALEPLEPLVYAWGTSLTRERFPFGPYSRPMPRPLRKSYGSRRFLMSEVPLDDARVGHSPHAFVVPCVGWKGSPETQRVM